MHAEKRIGGKNKIVGEGIGDLESHPTSSLATHVDRLLSTSLAAHYLGLSPSFLNKLRCTGGGPCYVKLGRRVLYPKAELECWLDGCRRRSTSDQEVR